MSYRKVIYAGRVMWEIFFLTYGMRSVVLWCWLRRANTTSSLLFLFFSLFFSVAYAPSFSLWYVYCLCVDWCAHFATDLFLILKGIKHAYVKTRLSVDPANVSACSLPWIPEWPGSHIWLNHWHYIAYNWSYLHF